MALRKIKELIREMVFENQPDEHEYAAVMANLVLDVDKWHDYETALEETKKLEQKYDAKIQKINTTLAKKKQKIEETKAQKQTLTPDVFKAAMAKLNKQQGILKNLQTQTIREKIDAGFPLLDSRIKKYACLKYLANTCINNSDFKTVVGQDGFIYADDYEFKSSEIAGHFREIRDYTDYIFGNRESKITNEESIADIIRADALSLGMPKEKLTAENISKIYNELLTRIAEENNKKQEEQEKIEHSHIGLKVVRDFGKGLKMYRLMPDTEYYKKNGEHRNLVYESNQMGICIGQKEQAYSQKILKGDENQYYTLRSEEKNGQLVPHCTIEVNGKTVNQIKGKANSSVSADYIKQVREFLKQDLGCTFPGERGKNTTKMYDIHNIGFIKDIRGNTVDVFNLPKDTQFDYFDYGFIKKGADIKNIKSIANLKITKQTITQKDIDVIKKQLGSVKSLDISDTKFVGDIDLSWCNTLSIKDSDFSKASNIKFNKTVDLRSITGLKGVIDFSDVDILNLQVIDFSNVTDIKCNKNASSITCTSLTGLKGTLDFSNVKKISLNGIMGLAHVNLNPNAEQVHLHLVPMNGVVDLSDINNLSLSGIDLSNVSEFKLNPNAHSIMLNFVKGLKLKKIDFSNVQKLEISNSDLSGIDEFQFNSNAGRIIFNNVKGLKGNLDFSDVWELEMSNMSLTDVNDIKFNDTMFVTFDKVWELPEILDFSSVPNLSIKNMSLIYDGSGSPYPQPREIKFNKNASNIKLFRVHGLKDLDLSGVNSVAFTATDEEKDMPNIKFNKNAENIRIWGSAYNIHTKMHGDHDFSDVKTLELNSITLADDANIKFNKNATEIALYEVKGLKGYLDFSNVQKFIPTNVDWSKVSGIKMRNWFRYYLPTRSNAIALRWKFAKNALMNKLKSSKKTAINNSGRE